MVREDDDDDRQLVEGEKGEEEREEQEEALVALIEHRAREVEHLKKRISYYTCQLEEAEKKLTETESLLARLRGQTKGAGSSAKSNGAKRIKVEASCSAKDVSQPQSKTELLIPAVNPRVSQQQPIKVAVVNSHVKVKEEKPSRSSDNGELVGTEEREKKRKRDQKEHKELIPQVCCSSSPCNIRCYASNHIPAQHRRKLRSLSLCPANDQLFVTSALDGMVNLWKIKARGSSASMISAMECLSQTRRWPEDSTWHPSGHSIISTYTADSGDSQISVIDLNKKQGKDRVSFLTDKPHTKGIINSVLYMPWDNSGFVTGGSDHAVVLWHERDEYSWKPKPLHRNEHSSAVMGVSGLLQKHVVLSAGADKRIIGYDVEVGRPDYNAQVDSKCMSVLPNPCDFNLFMVQTGMPQKQLRLFDFRLRRKEIHTLGFKQESSESQSALINQAWSPDGWYLTSGTVDPLIHVFDIRYNSHKPSQSIKAHQKRVFKAAWHNSLPLLISISSDGQVGLHKME